MSLIAWWPLDGSTENLGVGNYDVYAVNGLDGLSVNNDGKIGKCYQRTAVSTAKFNTTNTVLLDKDLSMCCWANITDTSNTNDTAFGIVTNHNHSANTGFGLNIKRISASDFRICCSTGNGSSRTFRDYYGTSNIKGAWHHLSLTYNHTKKEFQLWVDGKVEKTQSYTNAARADKISIFAWSTNYQYADYQALGRVNDVRIYDHCLSASEVGELAQGLVLHYPMMMPNGIIGGENLLQNTLFNKSKMVNKNDYSGILTLNAWKWTTVTITNEDKSTIKLTYPNGTTNVDWGLWQDIAIKANTSYTLSMDIKGDTRVFAGPTSQTPAWSGTGWFDNTAHSDWTHVTKTWNSGSNTNFRVILAVLGTKTVYYRNVKLEIGTAATPYVPSVSDGWTDPLKVYDCSGYRHNADYTAATKPEWASDDAPMKDGAYKFANNKKLYITDLPTAGLANSYTISWWAKKGNIDSVMHWGFNNGNRLNFFDYVSSHFANVGDGAGTPFQKNGVNVARISVNEWHHYAMTGDGTQTLLYVDGKLYGTAKTYRPITGSAIVINGWNTGTGYCFNGSMTDFRIYATALDGEAIKELYERGKK